MSPENNSFRADVRTFIDNHPWISWGTGGIAIAIYSIGNLAGRAVRGIGEYFGVIKKVDTVAREQLRTSSSSSSSTASLPSGRGSVDKLGATASDNPLAKTTEKLLAAYATEVDDWTGGWIMVPPKDLIKADEPFVIGSGAIGYEGNGRWKIHVSIDPSQMEAAIPILVEVLHGPDAPRLGFKMQTRDNLTAVHQIGKELAIIFDQKVEDEALKGNLKPVQDCLNALWNALYNAGIEPEMGYVLTPKTMDFIREMSSDTHVKEKLNLLSGKFDRAIPCPSDRNYFHYRDENIAPMMDDQIGDLRGVPGVYAASDIVEIAKTDPDFAHNPSHAPDPFLGLKITVA